MIKLKQLVEAKKKYGFGKNPRLRRCYELSGQFVTSNINAVLVHGTVKNPFGSMGPRGVKLFPEVKHAWVEIGDKIYDPVMDKELPKEVYEGLFSVHVDHKYTFQDVIRITNEDGTWGPWDEKGSIQENRETEKGKSLKQLGYAYNIVEIFRALLATELNLNDNDYVTRSKRFAIEHSDHQTTVNGELYHVMRYFVNPEHVFEASNPGEYFYKGPPVKGKEIYKSTEFLQENDRDDYWIQNASQLDPEARADILKIRMNTLSPQDLAKLTSHTQIRKSHLSPYRMSPVDWDRPDE